MKKNSLQFATLMLIAVIGFSCGNDADKGATKEESSTFNITAEIDSLNSKVAYLSERKEGEFVKLDSMAVQDGKFSFSGSVALPKVHYILFDGEDNLIPVFVENSSIEIKGTTTKRDCVTVTGSVIQDKLKAFQQELKPYNEKVRAVEMEYRALGKDADEPTLRALDTKFFKADTLRNLFIEKYIQSNLNSVIAPYLTLRYMVSWLGMEELEELNSSFSDDIRGSDDVQRIEERIRVVKSSAIGQPAPLFTMDDTEGNPVSLENFKGNYVLVDFWASWCGPCRRENPNVVEAYKKYHDQGLEILGVSLDKNKEKWLAAIEKDNLTWTHVSDLKGWKNAAGKIYGVMGIPHSVLLDKDGVIIAKNLREEKLHEKLEEIFNTNS